MDSQALILTNDNTDFMKAIALLDKTIGRYIHQPSNQRAFHVEVVVQCTHTSMPYKGQAVSPYWHGSGQGHHLVNIYARRSGSSHIPLSNVVSVTYNIDIVNPNATEVKELCTTIATINGQAELQ